MSRTSIENAIYTWIASASGCAVVWGDQNAPRDSSRYVSLRLSSVRSIGQDWQQVTDAPSPAPGLEILSTVTGRRQATLTMQLFNAASAPTGTSGPGDTLEHVRLSAGLESVRLALNTAGVGIAVFGPVLDIGGPLGSSRFEARSIMTVELNLIAELSELTTFIETVSVESDVDDHEHTLADIEV